LAPPLHLLLKRRPSHPTSAPYTTLFRSDRQRRYIRIMEIVPPKARGRITLIDDIQTIHLTWLVFQITLDRCRPGKSRFDQPCRPDRKSTRPNSSHVSISYAVFCLKKQRN